MRYGIRLRHLGPVRFYWQVAPVEPQNSGHCTYLNLFAVFALAEQGEFSVSRGSQSSHRLTRIYVTSSNTLDRPVRAFCADSMASNSRAFSFADRSIHAHLSNTRSISSVRISLSTGLSIPARSGIFVGERRACLFTQQGKGPGSPGPESKNSSERHPIRRLRAHSAERCGQLAARSGMPRMDWSRAKRC